MDCAIKKENKELLPVQRGNSAILQTRVLIAWKFPVALVDNKKGKQREQIIKKKMLQIT